jgi:hypothetical protein
MKMHKHAAEDDAGFPLLNSWLAESDLFNNINHLGYSTGVGLGTWTVRYTSQGLNFNSL